MTHNQFAYLALGLAGTAVPLTMVQTAPADAQSQGWNVVHQGNGRMVNGSGRLVQQARAVTNFSRIETRGAENVEAALGRARG